MTRTTSARIGASPAYLVYTADATGFALFQIARAIFQDPIGPLLADRQLHAQSEKHRP
jgi:hypothetical protein